MIIADTDVLIDFLRGRGGGAKRVALELETRSFGTTAIAAFELRSGARTAKQKAAIDGLLDAMTLLSLVPKRRRSLPRSASSSIREAAPRARTGGPSPPPPAPQAGPLR